MSQIEQIMQLTFPLKFTLTR